MVAADKEDAAELAAAAGDGLIVTSPDEELLSQFENAGGKRKPRFGQGQVGPDQEGFLDIYSREILS
jgi:hypothetical protein